MIRYPGSKKRLAPRLFVFVPETRNYVEPFVGGGGFAIPYLRRLAPGATVTLCDADRFVGQMWLAIRDSPRDLISRVETFVPSVESFFEFQRRELAGDLSGDAGFRKIAVHAMSFGGIGAQAGGPIGGRSQGSKYAVGCRWSPVSLSKWITRTHELLRLHNVMISSADFRVSLRASGFAYVDPPYVKAGPALYACSFTEVDHRELAVALLTRRDPWALSYDDHPLVRELYGDCEIVEIATSTQHGGIGGRGSRELLIRPANYQAPDSSPYMTRNSSDQGSRPHTSSGSGGDLDPEGSPACRKTETPHR